MIQLRIFPADFGDCFLCEFPVDGKTFRMLVDGGTAQTARVLTEYWTSLSPEERNLDLVVVTHIDNDHIGGILKILENPTINEQIREIWFNGYRHCPRVGLQELGITQGIKLETTLENDKRWNQRLNNDAITVEQDGSPKCIELGENAKIYVLSPGKSQLQDLGKSWKKVADEIQVEKIAEQKSKIQRLGNSIDINALVSRPFEQDTAEANGSSIAFLLEVNERRFLFAADAFPDVVCDTADKKWKDTLRIDLFKLSHHGSKRNTNDRIVAKFPASHYIISTNGKIHEHPDEEAIARVLHTQKNEKKLVFNYPTISAKWNNTYLKRAWNYDIVTDLSNKPIYLAFPCESSDI